MFDQLALRFQRFAPVFIRLGLAVVFFLFGLQKLTIPEQTTAEIQLLMNFDIADAAAINFYLGIAELLIALSFAFGFLVRVFAIGAAFLLTMFFLSFLVKYGTSINPALFRDIGLLASSIALFLLGAGPLSIDNRRKHE